MESKNKNKSKSNNDTAIHDQPAAALTEKCTQIRDLMCSANTRDAGLRYNIGIHVSEAMNDDGKYGQGAVEFIANELACTPASLYDHAVVARAWSRPEFDDVAKTSMSSGMRLSFSHFVLLAKIQEPARRASLLAECIKNNHAVRALKARIKELAPAKERAKVVPRGAVKKLVNSSGKYAATVQADLDTLAQVPTVTTEQGITQLETVRDGYVKARRLLEQAEACITKLLAEAKTSPEKAA